MRSLPLLSSCLGLESCGPQQSGELGCCTISTWNPGTSPCPRIARWGAPTTPQVSLPCLEVLGVFYRTWLCVCLCICIPEKLDTQGV